MRGETSLGADSPQVVNNNIKCSRTQWVSRGEERRGEERRGEERRGEERRGEERRGEERRGEERRSAQGQAD